MPFKDKSLYPPDWDAIALREKARAGWMCEECGADCFAPIDPRNILTVHHIDHNPANCAPNNLIALCTVCHMQVDQPWHARNAAITRTLKRAGSTIPIRM